MGRVVHFELFADEPGALVDFYTNVFGWDVSAWEGPFEYHLASTGPEREPGINGAIAPFGSAGDQRVVLTIATDDLDATAAAVVDAGGSAVNEKSPIPGTGWHQYFSDPSGSVFGALQPDRSAGMPEAVAPTAEAGAAKGPQAEQWAEVGDRLREIGVTVGQVVQDAADSPQGKMLREQAEKAATAIGEASRQAADKARPHVITALDRVSVELGELAARLRTKEPPAPEEGTAAEPPAEAPEGNSAEGGPEA